MFLPAEVDAFLSESSGMMECTNSTHPRLSNYPSGPQLLQGAGQVEEIYLEEGIDRYAIRIGVYWTGVSSTSDFIMILSARCVIF